MHSDKWRRFMVGGLAAALLIGWGGTASAAPVPPVGISPGGPFVGVSSQLVITDETTDVQLTCTYSMIEGSFDLEPGVSGTIDTGGGSCPGPFGLTFELTFIGPWRLAGVNFEPGTGVLTGTISDVEIEMEGIGCRMVLSGVTDFSHTNGVSSLSMLGSPPLEVSYVDPMNDCFGLIKVGDLMSVDGAHYHLDPPQTVS